jgi:hypothetical protein
MVSVFFLLFFMETPFTFDGADTCEDVLVVVVFGDAVVLGAAVAFDVAVALAVAFGVAVALAVAFGVAVGFAVAFGVEVGVAVSTTWEIELPESSVR